MKRTFVAGAAVVLISASPAFASMTRDADALMQAARRVTDPYARGLALGWLEIAARQDREVLISRTYNDAVPKALQNARHFIDDSVPFAPIYDTKRWPASDRPDWITALREIERVNERASGSPCKGEDAGRLSALSDEAWKEQDETHGTRWVHGRAQIERAKRLAEQIDRELDACHLAAPKPDVGALSADTLFAFDRATLSADGERAIAQLAGKAQGRAFDRLIVTGYSDRIGRDGYNLALSRRRADAVANALVAAGVRAEHVETHGLGNADPVIDCPGLTSDAVIACLAPNRRVTVEMVGDREVRAVVEPLVSTRVAMPADAPKAASEAIPTAETKPESPLDPKPATDRPAWLHARVGTGFFADNALTEAGERGVAALAARLTDGAVSFEQLAVTVSCYSEDSGRESVMRAQQRSEAVAGALAAHGVPAQRVSVLHEMAGNGQQVGAVDVTAR